MVRRANSGTPSETQFYLCFTSFLPLFLPLFLPQFNLRSAGNLEPRPPLQPAMSNHGLETTVYKPLGKHRGDTVRETPLAKPRLVRISIRELPTRVPTRTPTPHETSHERVHGSAHESVHSHGRGSPVLFSSFLFLIHLSYEFSYERSLTL